MSDPEADVDDRQLLADKGRSCCCQPGSSNVRQLNCYGWQRAPRTPGILDNSCQMAHDSAMSTGTMNIALPDALRAFVAQRVESGEYGNTSEYVRELIRKDQREQRVQRLRALVEDGLASGPATADTRDDWAELNAIADGRGQ